MRSLETYGIRYLKTTSAPCPAQSKASDWWAFAGVVIYPNGFLRRGKASLCAVFTFGAPGHTDTFATGRRFQQHVLLSQKTERPKSTGKDGRSSHETAAWDVVHLLLYYVDYRGTVLPNPVVAAVSGISLGHLPLSLVSSFVVSGPSSTDQSAGTAVCVLV